MKKGGDDDFEMDEDFSYEDEKVNLHHPLKMTITCLRMKGPAPSPKQKKIKRGTKFEAIKKINCSNHEPYLHTDRRASWSSPRIMYMDYQQQAITI